MSLSSLLVPLKFIVEKKDWFGGKELASVTVDLKQHPELANGEPLNVEVLLDAPPTVGYSGDHTSALQFCLQFINLA